MTGFAAALALLGLVVLILAGLGAASRLLAVARPVFAALLALSYYAGPARYSAAYYLEQKISWWWRLAELRRPAPLLTAATLADGTTSGQPHAA